MKKVGTKMWKAILALIEYIVKKWQYKSRVEDKIDMLIKSNAELKLETLRIKYLHFYHHQPWEANIISSIFDEYKKLGGNSWIDDLHEEWKKNLRKGTYKKPTKRSSK